MIPPQKNILFKRPSRKRTKDAQITIGISILLVSFLITSGKITDETPRIKRMLSMLLPTTLPTERSALPVIAALMLTAASGIEVPIATMVRPITICGILNFFAMLEAPSTKKSAPLAKKTKPRIKNRTFNEIEGKEVKKIGIKKSPLFFYKQRLRIYKKITSPICVFCK